MEAGKDGGEGSTGPAVNSATPEQLPQDAAGADAGAQPGGAAGSSESGGAAAPAAPAGDGGGAATPAKKRPKSSKSSRSGGRARRRRSKRGSVAVDVDTGDTDSGPPSDSNSRAGVGTPGGAEHGGVGPRASPSPSGSRASSSVPNAGGTSDGTPKPEEFHIAILVTARNRHLALVKFLRERAGFAVTERVDVPTTMELVSTDDTVKAVLLDLTENAKSIVTLARSIYAMPRSIPTFLFVPPIRDVDDSAELSRAVADVANVGVASLVEKPIDASALAFRMRVAIDRYANANRVFAEVCGAQQKKLPLPRRKEAADDASSGKGWGSVRKHKRRPSATARHDGGPQEDQVEDETSLDAQFYPPQRITATRRQRVQAPFEKMRNEALRKEDADREEDMRRSQSAIPVTDIERLFAAELKADMEAFERERMEQRRRERERWKKELGFPTSSHQGLRVRTSDGRPRDQFAPDSGSQLSASSSLSGFDTAKFRRRPGERSPGETTVGSDSDPHGRTPAAGGYGGAGLKKRTLRSARNGGGKKSPDSSGTLSPSMRKFAGLASLNRRMGGGRSRTTSMRGAASAPSLSKGLDGGPSFGSLPGGLHGAPGLRGFVAKLTREEREHMLTQSLARRPELVNPQGHNFTLPGSPKGGFGASLARAARRRSVVRETGFSTAPSQAPIPEPVVLRRRRILQERKEASQRASKGETFKLERHLDPGIPPQEAWLVWQGSDVINIQPKEPETVSLTNLSKADSSITRGLALVDRKDYEGAARLYSKAIHLDARQMVSYVLRACCYIRLGKCIAAIQDLHKVIEVHPGDVNALYNRAVARTSLGDHVAAMEDLTSAVAAVGFGKPPRHVLKARALLYRRLGMFLEANKEYSTIAEMYPEEHEKEVAALKDGEAAEEQAREAAAPRFEVPVDATNEILQHFLDGDSDGYDSEISDITSISSEEEEVTVERRRSLAVELPEELKEGIIDYQAGQDTPDNDGSDSEESRSSIALLPPLPQHGGQVDSALADILSNNADMYVNVFAKPTEAQAILQKRGSERTRWELGVICKMLSSLQFFRSLTEHVQLKMAKALSYKVYQPGDYVCRQGKIADQFFICMSGELAVKVSIETSETVAKSEITVNHMKAADAFGQLSILFNTKRGASVVAKVSSEVLGLSEKAFTELGLREVFLSELKDKEEVLRRSGIFEGMDPQQLRKLASIALPRTCKKGTVLVAQGDPPKSLFFLRRGICTVHKRHDVLADLELRITEVMRELQKVRHYYVYHHELRKGRLDFSGGAGESKDAAVDEAAAGGAGGHHMAKHKWSASSSSAVSLDKLGSKGSSGAVGARSGGGIRLSKPTEVLVGAAAEALSPEASAGMAKRLALEKELDQLRTKKERVVAARVGMHQTDIGRVFKAQRKSEEAWQALVATLYPPAIFGEQAILNPEEGFAQGSVIADTYVELLVLHKRQIDASVLPKNVRDLVREKSVRFPSNHEVYLTAQKEKHWDKFRAKLMRKVNKTKWPVDRTKLREFPGGESLVVE